MNTALWYLLARTTVNAWRVRLARLRNPRYALAAVVGLAYFGFVLWGQPSSRTPAEEPDFLGTVAALGPFLLLLYAGWTWVAGGSRSALAFAPAEVSLLFPAPLTRQALILYKIAKTQFPILVSALIWGVLWGGRRHGSPLTVAALFLAFTTIGLHRLGAALVHAGATASGRAGRRRAAVPIAVFATVVGAVAWSLHGAWPAIEAAGFPDVFRVMDDALGTAPARIALLPFTAVFAPLGATTPGERVSAMAVLGAIAGLHLVWVLRLDAAFEEAAATESARTAERLEALRRRQTVGAVAPTTRSRRSLPLATTGPAWVAITWKNLVHLVRSGNARAMLVPPALLFAMPLMVGDPVLRGSITMLAVGVFAPALLLVGPLLLRSDLRADLVHLAQLKAYPIPGWQMVLAEVGGSAIPLTAAQVALCLAAVASAQGTPASVEPFWVLAGCVGLPLLLGGLNATMLVIHNALALLFPGWSRPGSAPPAGIETMGTGILALAAVALAVSLACLAPGAAAAGTFFALQATGAVALPATLAATGAVAGLLLLAECWALGLVLGDVFDGLEPQDVR